MDFLIKTALEFSLRREEIHVDFMDAEHYHTGKNPFINSRYCLLFCLRGSAVLDINSNVFTFKEENMNVLAPDSIAEATYISPDFMALSISFSREFYRKLHLLSNGQFKLIGGADSHYMYNSRCANVLDQYIRGIHSYVNECSENLLNDTLAYHTLCFYNLFLSSNDGDFIKRIAMNTRFGSVVEEFFDLVQMYYRKKHAVNFYASELGVTERHLSRQIKIETGKTGKQIIRAIIVREAKALLNSTDMSMAEISNFLGFTDQSAFCKFFLESVGTTPSGYKKRK